VHTRPSAARTLDPTSGLYTSVSSDEKRIFGAQQGLLVEAAARTNHVEYAFDLSQWTSDSNIEVVSTSETSIVKGENAAHLGKNGKTITPAGIFTSSTETAVFYIEKDDASPTTDARLIVRDSVNFDVAVEASFDTTTGSASLITNGISVDVRGPLSGIGAADGGDYWEVHVRYDPTSSSNAGASRGVAFIPDNSGNGNRVYFHGTQLEEASNTSSPIATGSSAVTRSEDDYSISVGDWFNRNAGTFILHAEPRFFYQYGGHHVLEGDGTNERTYIKFTIPSGVVSIEDGNTSLQQSGLKHYSKNKIAASFDSDNRRLSVNGAYSESGHSGNLLSPGADIHIGKVDSSLLTIEQLIYIPRLLSESTLNTLTS